MAVHLEDVLARRTRCLLLNAQATLDIAPQVAQIMAQEMGKDETWVDTELKLFTEIVKNYIL